MITEETTQNNSEEYKNFEMELHREIMNSCRKYINKISIFSILGIMDYVKQEVVDLENATTQNLKRDPTIDIE